MAVVYESRLSLSEFWCNLQGGGEIETLSGYLKRHVSGTLALSTLKLEPSKRDRSTNWFVIRYGKGRQRRDIPIGVDSLVNGETLDRIAFDLGWIDSNEWDGGQVSWRLDSFEDRPPVSVCGYIVVACRKAPRHRFSVTDGTSPFTWIPLAALFPDLPANARFVGWKRAVIETERLQLQKVDEAYMFEKLFPPIYRNYVRTLLHLPIAVGKEIVKTVDFRQAEPKAFGPLLLRSGTYSPDTMFFAMVTFRVEIGVSPNGKVLALPRLPSRKVSTEFIELKRHEIMEGADIMPVSTVRHQPNWYAAFPIINSGNYFRVNMATLDHLDPFKRSDFVQRHFFPHSPNNLPISVVNKIFTWRMKWAYTFPKLLAVSYKSKGDSKSIVYISLLKPWY